MASTPSPTAPPPPTDGGVCTPLNASVCEQTCLPFDFGTAAQANFACSDWWHTSHCCPTSETHTHLTSVFRVCECRNASLSPQALAVLISLSLASALAVAIAAYYLISVRRHKRDVRADQRDQAVDEAELYLPR